MESGILQQTGGIASRFTAAAALLFVPAAWAAAAALFEEDAALELTLRGPLGAIEEERDAEQRNEYPFTLTVDGSEIPVMLRVRGKSRTVYCSFPPIRLRFDKGTTDGTPFVGQTKLKLVTHCRSNKKPFENNALDEYTAYRMFNHLTEIGYRVRLVRISYEDTDGKLKHLDHPYFGYLIESDAELARRVDGTVKKTEGVVYSHLNAEQTARMNVFQYMIANNDWSFVTNNEDDYCCHNVDLIALQDELFPVPYDFDLSGIVDASYAKPPPEVRIRSVTQRKYRGYCMSSIDDVAKALDDIVALREDIMATVDASPAISDRDRKSRTKFIGRFFEEATDNREKLLKNFNRDCVD